MPLMNYRARPGMQRFQVGQRRPAPMIQQPRTMPMPQPMPIPPPPPGQVPIDRGGVGIPLPPQGQPGMPRMPIFPPPIQQPQPGMPRKPTPTTKPGYGTPASRGFGTPAGTPSTQGTWRPYGSQTPQWQALHGEKWKAEHQGLLPGHRPPPQRPAGWSPEMKAQQAEQRRTEMQQQQRMQGIQQQLAWEAQEAQGMVSGPGPYPQYAGMQTQQPGYGMQGYGAQPYGMQGYMSPVLMQLLQQYMTGF